MSGVLSRGIGRRPVAVAAALMTAASLAVAANPGTAAATNKTPDHKADNQVYGGGSNYNWYQITNCDREPYGVIKNFPKGKAVIGKQLTQMRAAGQQRLRFGIFHHHGPDSGTLMNSTGGKLSPRNTQNLRDFLAAVRAAKFREISVSIHTNGVNNPNGWTDFRDDLYNENLQLIRYIRPILTAAKIPYRIDLGAELIPDINQPRTLEYAQKLWRAYTDEFGLADTVGFSVIGSRPTRIANIPKVYGDRPPHLLDLHLYGSPEFGDEYQLLTKAHQQLNALGYRQGVVISETYYNDATAANGLRKAIDETGRRVYWVTQWPLSRTKPCNEHVDVAPPVAFDAFRNANLARNS